MKILSIKDYSGKLSAGVQASGRMVFSGETSSDLQLKDKMGISFAQDDDGTLYCALHSEDNGDAFKIRKSGDYFYVPTSALFKALDVDYENKKISFNLIRSTEKDGEMNGRAYRMDIIVGGPRKKSAGSTGEESPDNEPEQDADDDGDEQHEVQ